MSPSRRTPLPLLPLLQFLLCLRSCEGFLPHRFFRIATHGPRHVSQDVEVLAPGLVYVRGVLTMSEQQDLAHAAAKLGRRPDLGFIEANGRARMYDRVAALPSSFRRLCARAVSSASAADANLPACVPTHCLTNCYRTPHGLRWHRDIYRNDGDGDAPIVNLSVGASCRFGVRLEDGTVRELTLCSGDALLFGGPSRFVEHAVLEIKLDERPDWMDPSDPHRLSFTFREAPSVLGQEAKYRTFDVSTSRFEETQRAWRPNDGLVE